MLQDGITSKLKEMRKLRVNGSKSNVDLNKTTVSKLKSSFSKQGFIKGIEDRLNTLKSHKKGETFNVASSTKPNKKSSVPEARKQEDDNHIENFKSDKNSAEDKEPTILVINALDTPSEKSNIQSINKDPSDASSHKESKLEPIPLNKVEEMGSKLSFKFLMKSFKEKRSMSAKPTPRIKFLNEVVEYN